MKIGKGLVVVLLAIVAGSNPRAEQAGLETFEVVQLAPTGERSPDRMQIRAFGRGFRLDLAPNRALLASLPDRQRQRIGEDDLFLKGTLDGVAGSWVRLNRIDGRFSGGFFDGDELFLIDSAGAFAGTREHGISRDVPIIFRFSDLQSSFLIDHGAVTVTTRSTTQAGAADYKTFTRHLREIVALEGSSMLAMPLTIVTDVDFGNALGTNTASTVVGRTNFIDGLYSDQLGIGIQLFHHEPLAGNGTLTATDASDLLSQFRDFMRTGDGSDIPFSGLAHLFTGRDLDGSTAGIAFLGTLCSSWAGYGVDQNLSSETVSALIYAHEVGHNFNAPHDGEEGQGQLGACSDETFAGIMRPSISTSRQEFSPCSLDQMSEAAATASCLVEVEAEDNLFVDGFEPPAT